MEGPKLFFSSSEQQGIPHPVPTLEDATLTLQGPWVSWRRVDGRGEGGMEGSGHQVCHIHPPSLGKQCLLGRWPWTLQAIVTWTSDLLSQPPTPQKEREREWKGVLSAGIRQTYANPLIDCVMPSLSLSISLFEWQPATARLWLKNQYIKTGPWTNLPHKVP